MIFFYINYAGRRRSGCSITGSEEVNDGKRSPFRAFALNLKKSEAVETALVLQVSVKKWVTCNEKYQR